MPTTSKKKFTDKVRQKRLGSATYPFFDFFSRDRTFFPLIFLLFLLTFYIHSYRPLAMAFGFCLSSYGVIANDSIQTLGLFITANIHKRRVWQMWAFISIIFVFTALLSWLLYQGDLSYQRLSEKGLDKTPEAFTTLQLIGPLLLLFLTRLRIPVSTTFFLLNSFASHPGTLIKMIQKSLIGYGVGFVAAFFAWVFMIQKKWTHFEGKPKKIWFLIHWVSIGLLWMAWLMQDSANLVIFLPRKLSFSFLLLYMIYIAFLLLLLFYSGGSKLQEVVNTKTGVTDIRSATLITIFYTFLLFFFTIMSKTPMSTTFVFIGILGGRELAKAIMHTPWRKHRYKTLYLIRRDLQYALLGLLIAVAITWLINPSTRPFFL